MRPQTGICPGRTPRKPAKPGGLTDTARLLNSRRSLAPFVFLGIVGVGLKSSTLSVGLATQVGAVVVGLPIDRSLSFSGRFPFALADCGMTR